MPQALQAQQEPQEIIQLFLGPQELQEPQVLVPQALQALQELQELQVRQEPQDPPVLPVELPLLLQGRTLL